MSELESDDDDALFFMHQEELSSMTPEMRSAVEDANKLLIVCKTMLIGLRLRNIDANNIVALAALLYQRGDANAE
jgi:hypothetical protein